jgi:hypothetical protein
MTEPRASYDDTRASFSGGMFLARATVHRTIMISIVMPRQHDARQITGSGHGVASEMGEIAMAPPIAAMNRMAG